jgi:hypothetical protein
MRMSVRIYFRRENEISLRHVTFFRHAAVAENQAAGAAKRPAVQGLINLRNRNSHLPTNKTVLTHRTSERLTTSVCEQIFFHFCLTTV